MAESYRATPVLSLVPVEQDWLDDWHFSFDDLPGGPNALRAQLPRAATVPKERWLAAPGASRSELEEAREALKAALASVNNALAHVDGYLVSARAS